MEYMILPFKRYFDFNGRSRRKEFWLFQLLNFIVAMVLAGPFYFSVVNSAISNGADMSGSDTATMEAAMADMGGGTMIMLGLYGLYALAAFIPSIAVTIRRLHDRDMSGWWYLGVIVASFIPFVNFIAAIAFIVLMVLPGTQGANRFGPDPKDPTSAEVFS